MSTAKLDIERAEAIYSHVDAILELIKHHKTVSLNGWYMDTDCPSGTWTWSYPGKDTPVWVHATPWWDHSPDLPFVVCTNEHDDGIYRSSVEFIPTFNAAYDAERYLSLVTDILRNVQV